LKTIKNYHYSLLANWTERCLEDGKRITRFGLLLGGDQPFLWAQEFATAGFSKWEDHLA